MSQYENPELQELIDRIIKHNNNDEIDLVVKAFEVADKAHLGQLRNSGEPYITHPLAVAQILANLEMDITTIAAGLLHDVVEDTSIGLDIIKAQFGAEVALLVDGVTKLSRIEYRSKEEQQVENYRKMFIAMAKDIRVVIIKLADRLHNMRTLKHQSFWKQREIAIETLEIFAPLAHRLGIFKIKWELEDLAFRYLEAEKYYDLVDSISMKRREREAYINTFIEVVTEKFSEVGIRADIQGRPKHFYSIYKKMVNQGKELNEIYDLTAVRVIVDSVKDCYGALGIIHTLGKPLPGRFKDYIAMPKANMYQSLHTTLVGHRGEPIEIQIRTWDMHRTAEYGVAAHWKYKEGNTKLQGKNSDEKMAWLRQIIEWQNELKDAKEFMETLKIDIFSDVVFVFTPKGDVIELPAGSTPIDFAYRIHSDVGHRCVGSKINGRIVTLDYNLQNGDIVEILTSKQAAGPSRDWLKIVKTSQAKNRIRQWFKKEKRDDNLVRGRELLEKETRRQGFEVAEFSKQERLEQVAKKLSISSAEEMLVALGDGVITPLQVVARLRDEFNKGKKLLEEVSFEQLQNDLKKWSGYGKASKGIRVKGVDDVMIRLSRCCNPLPGDTIVGYITRGRGVSIHRADCPNILNHKKEEGERTVEVAWDEGAQSSYQVELEINALDRPKLAAEVMLILNDMKANVTAISARSNKNGLAAINAKLEIKSLEHFNSIVDKIKRLKDVLDVHRVIPRL